MNMNRIFRTLLLAGIFCLASSFPIFAGERVTLEKPIKIATVKLDKTRVAGSVISYDDVQVDWTNDKGESQTLLWTDLDSKNVFSVYSTFLQKGSAEQWAELGALLWARDDGKDQAEKAFTRAVRLDAAIKGRINEIKAAPPPTPDEGEDEDDTKVDDRGDKPRKGDGGRAGAGPQTVGDIQNKYWGNLSDEEMDSSVKTLKKFADDTKERVNDRLRLYETKYFLFYSDLDPREANNWAGLLDKMYARLCTLFGVKKDTNVWRGKALVFVFQHQNDYQTFQTEMHGTDASWSAGMCHSFGDGMVHIAFYRQSNQLTFAHVLVHESVHGFIHRYRSPVSIPSWINEGLAEVLASELVPEPGRPERIRQHARNNVQEQGGLPASFFADRQIRPWAYPVAEALTTFMIVNKKKGYVEFINGIKDGLKWEKALEEKFGASRDKLSTAFQQDLGVRKLR